MSTGAWNLSRWGIFVIIWLLQKCIEVKNYLTQVKKIDEQKKTPLINFLQRAGYNNFIKTFSFIGLYQYISSEARQPLEERGGGGWWEKINFIKKYLSTISSKKKKSLSLSEAKPKILQKTTFKSLNFTILGPTF